MAESCLNFVGDSIPFDDIRQFLLCPFCGDIVTKAVTSILCSHSYCSDCVMRGDSSNNGIICPVCQKGLQRQDLRENRALDVLSQRYIARNISSVTCVQCNNPNVKPVCLCVSCPVYLCKDCASRHCLIPVCKEHRLVTMVATLQGKIDVELNCSTHRTKHLTEFCADCKELLCGECALISHQRHQRQSITKALEDSLAQLKDLNILDSEGKPNNCHGDRCKQSENEIKTQGEKVKCDILAQRDKIIDRVNRHYKCVCSQVDSICVRHIEQVRDEAKLNSEDTKALEHWAKVLIDNIGGASLLMELHSGLLQQLTVGREQPKQAELMSFQPSDENWQPVETELTQVQLRRSKSPVRHPRDNRGHRRGKYIGDNYRKTILSLDVDSLKRSRHVETIELQTNTLPYRMCLFNNKLWIPCLEDGIMVFSTYGNHLRTIRLDEGFVEQPRSLYPFDITIAEKMVLAAKNGLYLIDHNGKVLYTFSEGNFDDVTIDNRTMVALEENEQAMHIWNLATYNMRKIKVSFSQKLWATLFISNGIAYVCDSYVGTIHTYSLNEDSEDTMPKVQDMGASTLNYPYICGMDHRGILLVTDKNKDRLQCRTKNGSTRVLENFTVESPVDAVISRKSMYVLHGSNSRKLSIFDF